jgi:hypothetical protein
MPPDGVVCVHSQFQPSLQIAAACVGTVGKDLVADVSRTAIRSIKETELGRPACPLRSQPGWPLRKHAKTRHQNYRSHSERVCSSASIRDEKSVGIIGGIRCALHTIGAMRCGTRALERQFRRLLRHANCESHGKGRKGGRRWVRPAARWVLVQKRAMVSTKVITSWDALFGHPLN